MQHTPSSRRVSTSVVVLVTIVAAPFATLDAQPKRGAPLAPGEAAAHMTLPEGFRARLVAGEPDVVQPIAFRFDARGRLWVAECRSYPDWKPTGSDRIVIFEDVDGDGAFDARKAFWSEGNYLTGFALGLGGVWVGSAPHLSFIPDRDGDDRPDGPPEVHLDGWSHEGVHNVLNGLTWGPDGWLYGGNGILAGSKVGAPGTPAEKRAAIDCGVWRYHPTRRVFEVVAHGTTNPWGFDFDEHGQLFASNCVIPHLFHVVPGAHYIRMFGQDLDPYVYGLIESCADHLHWAGEKWQDSRSGTEHARLGGGHAHAGAMVYLGDNWPDDYRGRIFLSNLHGHRLNQDILERRGSGYVARHGDDFLFANHWWFQGLEVQGGPDGAVYLSDWCDDGECHGRDPHRESGRIFRIAWGDAPARRQPFDLETLADELLVELQLHRNDWFVRQARLVLQGRAVRGELAPETHGRLRAMLAEHRDVTRRLRAFWALWVTGGGDETLVLELLADPSEYLRASALTFELEDRTVSDRALAKLAELARGDPSPFVRLALASGLQRLEVAQRWAIAAGLALHAEDAGDANLPLMIWYGIEPLVRADPKRALELALRGKIPLLRRHVSRRVAELAPEGNDRPR